MSVGLAAIVVGVEVPATSGVEMLVAMLKIIQRARVGCQTLDGLLGLLFLDSGCVKVGESCSVT